MQMSAPQLAAAVKLAGLAALAALAGGCASVPDPGPARGEPATTAFPRTVALDDGAFTIYEPQIEDHSGFTQATAWSAAAYRATDDETVFGAIKYRAAMIVDRENRLVTIYDREILELRFPDLDEAQAETLVTNLRANIKSEPEILPLDVVLGYLADDAAKTVSVDVSLEPPTILYAEEPTMLVVLDGEPVEVGVEGADGLSIVINTNWDLFRSQGADAYFLLLGDAWLSAATLDGPWAIAQAPAGLDALPEVERFERVRNAIPGGDMANEAIPQIAVAQAPAELIVTDGPAELEPVAGAPLSFVANTSSDIVFNHADALYYVLMSGRWFSAASLAGPWAATRAPAEFQNIPADHPRGHVRAAVAGTPEAIRAVTEAQLPETAAVSRDTEPTPVFYAGDAPEFEQIDDLDVYRLVNTTSDVFRVGDLYYLCQNAVWFVAEAVDGPWMVADEVPAALYDIPSSSPAHHVTYVQVYESEPDVVYVGYTPGYNYTYVSDGVVVYGSGHYWGTYYYPYSYTYNPYWYYYPYPYTYGQASVYQTATGSYVHGHYAYGPYGGYWEGSNYNPRTGRYGGGAYAWDYDTGVYQGWSYNPRTDVSVDTRQAVEWGEHGAYDTWGETVVRRDDAWVSAERSGTEDGFRREIETSAGGQAVQVGAQETRATVARTGDGELYAGANGDVYRRTEDGQWETRSDGDWTSVDTQAVRDDARSRVDDLGVDAERLSSVSGGDRWRADVQGLERDFDARANGWSRYESFQSQRSGGRLRGQVGGLRR